MKMSSMNQCGFCQKTEVSIAEAPPPFFWGGWGEREKGGNEDHGI